MKEFLVEVDPDVLELLDGKWQRIEGVKVTKLSEDKIEIQFTQDYDLTVFIEAHNESSKNGDGNT